MIKPRSGRHRGRLVGGCLEVIDWLRGAPIWPDHFVWRDSIVFLEISEDAPSASALVRMLRALTRSTSGFLNRPQFGDGRDAQSNGLVRV